MTSFVDLLVPLAMVLPFPQSQGVPQEYKPGFLGWLLSMFVAAGFGSLAADGVRHLVARTLEKDAQLILRDKQCNWSPPPDIGRFICNYYFENVGDKRAYITRLVIGNEVRESFWTNSPIVIYSDESQRPVQTVHVAIAQPHAMLMLATTLQPELQNNRICLYNGEKALVCT